MQQALIATILFCILYSIQLVLQQKFVTTIQPLHLNFLTYAVASLLMTGYFLIFNRNVLKIQSKKGVFYGFLVALSGAVIADFLIVYGFKFSSSVNYSLLSRMGVMFTFILSIFLLREKITKNKIIAVILSLVGGTFIVYKFGLQLTINSGDLFFIIATLCLSLNNVFSKKALLYITPNQLTYLRICFAAIFLGIITFIFFPIKTIVSSEFIILNSLLSIAGISLISYAIKRTSPAFFSIVASLLPLFTIFFSFFIFHKLPVLSQLLGGLLIVFSIFLFQKKQK